MKHLNKVHACRQNQWHNKTPI